MIANFLIYRLHHDASHPSFRWNDEIEFGTNSICKKSSREATWSVFRQSVIMLIHLNITVLLSVSNEVEVASLQLINYILDKLQFDDDGRLHFGCEASRR